MVIATLKRHVLVICLAGCFTGDGFLSAQQHIATSEGKDSNVVSAMASQSLAFTKNNGQWPDSILFRASANGATMWFTKNGIWYQFFRMVEKSMASATSIDPSVDTFDAFPGRFDHERDSVETAMVKAEFVGASEAVEVVGLGEQEYKCNYFIGNDATKWRTDVPNYSSVTMRGLYPGVDVTFSSKDGHLKEELTALTSGDLAQVKIEYRGADGVTTQTDHITTVQTFVGEHHFEGALLADQSTSKSERQVSSATSSASAVTLVYSTYLGSSGEDMSYAIAVDSAGAAYVTGYTHSTNFPTLNPYQTYQGNVDVFVTKLSSAGNGLVYSTYLGGGSHDVGRGIAVDASGAAYVTGQTASSNFPTLNPYQTYQGGWDVFVTKLNTAGNSLVYSTYLGGNNQDHGYAIAVNAAGAAYVTGYTNSTDFPTLNPYQSTHQGASYEDVFVTKLSSAGNGLVYSTYLGGSGNDRGEGITVDASGAAYVTGWTSSTNFPTLNPYQANQGGDDIFVTKLNSAGNSLVYSTHLGGSFGDVGYDIVVDAAGAAYVTGYTTSTDFPTLNPYQTDQVGSDAFVSKFSSAGNSLAYSTYLGGSSVESFPLSGGSSIAVDAAGAAYVTSYTWSTDFPTLNPYQGTHQGGTSDAFVTKFGAFSSCCIGSTGDVDCSMDGIVDISDLSRLIDHMLISLTPLCCAQSANVDGSQDGVVDISDLSRLIDYMLINFTPTAACQ